MFNQNTKGNVKYYTSSLFEAYGIVHGFFTRHGGVSRGDFCSLNVSTARKNREGNTDDTQNVEQNYAICLDVLGTTCQKSVSAKQVHGNVVHTVRDGDGGRGITKEELDGCDGLYLGVNTSGINTLCVKTADCVPILLASKDGAQVSAVHAGWRGTVGDIATKAAEKFSCDRNDIIAAIGPCINSCCYQVGWEVYEAVKTLFEQKGIGGRTDEMFIFENGKINADLSKINKTLLMNFGLPEQNIDVSGICTCCNEHDFFSHRKSGGFSGTFLSAVRKNG